MARTEFTSLLEHVLSVLSVDATGAEEPNTNSLQSLYEDAVGIALRLIVVCSVRDDYRDVSAENLFESERQRFVLNQMRSECSSIWTSSPVSSVLSALNANPFLEPISIDQLLSDLYEACLDLRPFEATKYGDSPRGIEILELPKQRRRRGAFYTPPSLVRKLVEMSFETLESSIKSDPIKLCGLKVIDPAMGTGAFVIEAFRQLCDLVSIAMKTSGLEEAEVLRHFEVEAANESLSMSQNAPLSASLLSLIASKCIYGVDIDTTAVDVARLRLWGAVSDASTKPASLQANLRCGNSLVGARFDSALTIPASLFSAKEFRQIEENAQANLDGSPSLLPGFEKYFEAYSDAAFTPGSSDSLENKEKRVALCDLWCSLWFMDAETRMTSSMALVNPESTHREFWASLIRTVSDLKGRHKYFHFFESFSSVYDHSQHHSGGFDLVIGNPPWEIEKPNSREFFGMVDSSFWTLGKQQALIRQKELLRAEPKLDSLWAQRIRDHDSFIRWTRKSPSQFNSDVANFEYQGRGDGNLYKLFVERSYQLCAADGVISVIVPAGLATDSGTREIREMLLEKCRWHRLVVLHNGDGSFEIHRSFKYCLVVATRGGETDSLRVYPPSTSTELVTESRASSEAFELSRQSIRLFSPRWLSILELERPQEIDVVAQIYSSSQRLDGAQFGEFEVAYARELDMTLDSSNFVARDEAEMWGFSADAAGRWVKGNVGKDFLECPDESLSGSTASSLETLLPLYEGRMIGQFEFNAKKWKRGRGRQAVWAGTEYGDDRLGPQYLVPLSVLAERSVRGPLKVGFLAVGSPTNTRTMIASCLSEFPCGNSVPVLFLRSNGEGAEGSEFPSIHSESLNSPAAIAPPLSQVEWTLALCGILNSFPFDFVLRRKMSGNNLNYFVVGDCPVPIFESTSNGLWKTLSRVVAHLNLRSAHFDSVWISLGYSEPPRCPSEAEFRLLRAITESIVAMLYRLSRQEFYQILFSHWDERSFETLSLSPKVSPKGFHRVDKTIPVSERLPACAFQNFERLHDLGTAEFLREVECYLDRFSLTEVKG